MVQQRNVRKDTRLQEQSALHQKRKEMLAEILGTAKEVVNAEEAMKRGGIPHNRLHKSSADGNQPRCILHGADNKEATCSKKVVTHRMERENRKEDFGMSFSHAREHMRHQAVAEYMFRALLSINPLKPNQDEA